ncbi:hypothetical protein EVAR_69619_1 [Eumeta japonica]|uniref:Uncharacterized protein n=1 Tax=Eumeta variegata TaxID=151549 RepID=A0A4C2A593_EUMVA|nr:hypothetical protein EVAR_69619_1 [Eumeta japonica]
MLQQLEQNASVQQQSSAAPQQNAASSKAQGVLHQLKAPDKIVCSAYNNGNKSFQLTSCSKLAAYRCTSACQSDGCRCTGWKTPQETDIAMLSLHIVQSLARNVAILAAATRYKVILPI